jgi:4-hydroxybenzoate polyprenyltransferase
VIGFLHRFLQFITSNHLWIALGVTSLFAFELASPIFTASNAIVLLWIFGSTLAGYAFLTLVISDKLKEFPKRHIEILRSEWISLILGSLIIVPISLFIPRSLFLPIVVSVLGTLLYVLPVNHYGRLVRNLPFIKIGLVALIWMVVTGWMPAIIDGNSPDISLLASRFFFIAGLTLPFDLRDIKADANSDTMTFVRYWGWRRTQMVALIFLGISFLMEVFGNRPQTDIFALSVTLIVAAALIVGLNANRSNLYYSFGLDGTLLLPLLLKWLIDATCLFHG